jgi:hypothetical protein
LNDARVPIASLISKSAKAQQKLAAGTWQHRMLRDNLKALQIASALMNKATEDPGEFERDELQTALAAFASMIGRAEKAKSAFASGTSQHSLQRNRLKALRVAEALVMAELDRGDA